jgi:hypothetical protein
MKRILMVLVVGVVGAAALIACGDKKPATDPSAMSAPTTTGTDTTTMPSTPSTDTSAMPTTSATP